MIGGRKSGDVADHWEVSSEQVAAHARAGLRRQRRGRAWLFAGLVTLAVLLTDQLSKRLVEHSVSQGEEKRLLPGIDLVHTRNHGVAFGFFPGSDTGVTVLIGVALAALLVHFARNSAQRLIWLPTGLLLGGALGNIIDRVRAGAVTDFLKFPLGWPPFNLADVSITLGILSLLALIDHTRRAER